MPRSPKSICALSIGGLDPGGGAGLLADARAFGAAGVFAAGAAAMLTVQSASGLKKSVPTTATLLGEQMREVLRNQDVRAIKVGALGSAQNVAIVADFLAIHREIPSVVDTVMRPTRGRDRLLNESAIAALRTKLIPRATLLTVNGPEASVLSAKPVTTLREAKEAGRILVKRGARAVLVKGGHLSGKHAIDLLITNDDVIEFSEKRLELPPIHGGGCVLASLIAGRLAHGDDDLEASIRWAKKIHYRALRKARDIGGDMSVLLA